jgi:hypothetical protein
MYVCQVIVCVDFIYCSVSLGAFGTGKFTDWLLVLCFSINQCIAQYLFVADIVPIFILFMS